MPRLIGPRVSAMAWSVNNSNGARYQKTTSVPGRFPWPAAVAVTTVVEVTRVAITRRRVAVSQICAVAPVAGEATAAACCCLKILMTMTIFRRSQRNLVTLRPLVPILPNQLHLVVVNRKVFGSVFPVPVPVSVVLEQVLLVLAVTMRPASILPVVWSTRALIRPLVIPPPRAAQSMLITRAVRWVCGHPNLRLRRRPPDCSVVNPRVEIRPLWHCVNWCCVVLQPVWAIWHPIILHQRRTQSQ
mmetsp:Transcript_13900/g.28717  ORF Transcript_13900/g.28717 Transcript_13900/m.28717 type:complete len:244 (+) Transcript_13900:1695-2426(+)